MALIKMQNNLSEIGTDRSLVQTALRNEREMLLLRFPRSQQVSKCIKHNDNSNHHDHAAEYISASASGCVHIFIRYPGGTMMDHEALGRSVCRKQSAQMASRGANFTQKYSAQRGEEHASTLAKSTQMTQRREAKPNRRSVFDEMYKYNHFGGQRVRPGIGINPSFAPTGCGEMRFGDLDFSTDDFHFET